MVKHYLLALYEVFEVSEHLSYKVASRFLLTSFFLWTTIDFVDVYRTVQSQQKIQSDNYANRASKLTELIDRTQTALFLGSGDLEYPEQVFASYDSDFQKILKDIYRLTYTLAMHTSSKKNMKLTKAGWAITNEIDIKLLNHVENNKNKKIFVDYMGNLVLVRTGKQNEMSFTLLLRISTQSIGKFLHLDGAKLVHEDNQDYDDLKNGPVRYIKLLIGDGWQLVYSEPEISLFTEYHESLRSNGLWLLIVAIGTATLLFIGYTSLSAYIAEEFRQQIKKKNTLIESISEELDKSKTELTHYSDLNAKKEIQAQAESKLLFGIVSIHQLIAFLRLGIAFRKDIFVPNEEQFIYGDDHLDDVLQSTDVDLLQEIQNILNCLEVSRFQNRVNIQLITQMKNHVVPTDPWVFKIVLYNIIKRALIRSKEDGELELTLSESDENIILSLKDNGYFLEENHKSYFERPVGISLLMAHWDRVVFIAEKTGINITHVQLSNKEFQTNIELPFNRKLSPIKSEEDRTNVIPFMPKT